SYSSLYPNHGAKKPDENLIGLSGTLDKALKTDWCSIGYFFARTCSIMSVYLSNEHVYKYSF
ncbi:MAG: hypothetical protein KAR21_06445, partial [Spirochaetales bacterium]|nr:hypothetical protein [Spirochaetales bacterium]